MGAEERPESLRKRSVGSLFSLKRRVSTTHENSALSQKKSAHALIETETKIACVMAWGQATPIPDGQKSQLTSVTSSVSAPPSLTPLTPPGFKTAPQKTVLLPFLEPCFPSIVFHLGVFSGQSHTGQDHIFFDVLSEIKPLEKDFSISLAKIDASSYTAVSIEGLYFFLYKGSHQSFLVHISGKKGTLLKNTFSHVFLQKLLLSKDRAPKTSDKKTPLIILGSA